MIDPNSLTRDAFLDELFGRIDALRLQRVEVPDRIDSSVLAIVGVPDDPFGHDLFRVAAAHLLDGIDPELALAEGGADLVEDRLAALAVNLQVSLRVAADRHEQPV